MPRISVNGWKFLYRQAGTGPDVVLLPGASRVAFSRSLFDALALDFRVTVYQPRVGPVETPNSADVADDLHALHGKLGLGPSYLLAHGASAVAALHAAVLYPDAVAGLVLAEPRLPGARNGTAPDRRSGLTTRRILSIEQPVVATCGPRSPALPLCRFLEDRLPRCKAAPAPEDAVSLVASIREHLREMAGTFHEIGEAASGSTSKTGPRGPHYRSWPEVSDGRGLARWMARLSAWGS
jgi:pimeloyl-ACP methyl ester carboxylesterase